MVQISKLKNGLTLIVEEMPHFESVSYDLHLPGGIVTDAPNCVGTALVLSELIERGAGHLTSRGFSDAFDILGARHSSSAVLDRFLLKTSLLSHDLEKALALTALQVREAALPPEEIENIVQLLLMDLNSLGDNPARACMVELTKRFFPPPYNRTSLIDEEAVPNIDSALLTQSFKRLFSPSGAILSVAGKCNSERVANMVESLFGDWSGPVVLLPAFEGIPPFPKHHEQRESAQVQIALAYPSAKFGDELYYTAKLANEVLSGGMFGRLFIEVREKRGLCYSVHARHSSGKHSGAVFAYAGTTPERASETLTVMVEVLSGLKGSLTSEELERAKVNLKSNLIIAEESPGARAASNAGDFWLSGRVRPLEEIGAAIEAITATEIDSYIDRYPPHKHALVTLGSREIGG